MTNLAHSAQTHATIGGTIFAVFGVSGNSLLSTIVLAAVGATVSFFISKGLGLIFKKKKRINDENN